jgi:hypothetical protein
VLKSNLLFDLSYYFVHIENKTYTHKCSRTVMIVSFEQSLSGVKIESLLWPFILFCSHKERTHVQVCAQESKWSRNIILFTKRTDTRARKRANHQEILFYSQREQTHVQARTQERRWCNPTLTLCRSYIKRNLHMVFATHFCRRRCGSASAGLIDLFAVMQAEVTILLEQVGLHAICYFLTTIFVMTLNHTDCRDII